ncbi:MAG: hypothetical protein VZQ28_03080 [Methanomethylophilus sp.]|nr:hypothetical protein [Methanomethylophilus sp.]
MNAMKGRHPPVRDAKARTYGRGRKAEQTAGTASYDPCGILRVHCRGCDQVPDAGSPACIRCITAAISSEGAAERIWLEGGKDTEIHGPAAEILCDLAQIRTVLRPSDGRRCSSCGRSPERVIGDAWADFPDPSFASACDRLYSLRDDSPECTACLQRTRAALMMADDGMARVREKAARIASRRRDAL